MAILQPLDDEQRKWIKSRPPAVRALIKRLPPNRLYLLKSSGHRVFIYSYSENGTVTVAVTGQYNLVTIERRVFGIAPDDLEECDLPPPDEKVGVILKTDEEVRAFIEMKRREHEAEQPAKPQ